jgi:DNA-binding beta-propeller fold protein YncE
MKSIQNHFFFIGVMVLVVLLGCNTQIAAASSIAADNAGNVYSYSFQEVNFYQGHAGLMQVQKYAPDGTMIKQWGFYGNHDSTVNYPMGITTDSSGNIFTLMIDGGCDGYVTKSDSLGNALATWKQDGCLSQGLIVDKSGNVYSECYEGTGIQKVNDKGTFITRWDSSGIGSGHFGYIADLAIDRDDNIYAVDSGNNQILKFTPTGKCIMKFGSQGSGDGQFYSPDGIAVDRAGCIYVLDEGNHQVQKFTSTGKFITKWGIGDWSNDLNYNDASGIAVDCFGDVYVEGGGKIQKFTSAGIFVTKWTNPTPLPVMLMPYGVGAPTSTHHNDKYDDVDGNGGV